MKENRLRVMVIESDPDRVQLLEEAFCEMEELRFARPVYPACARDYALDWQEAVGRLAGTAADVILVNISHECEPSAPAAFRALRAVAPSAALVAIAGTEDEPAAVGLMRMGAQDYLIEAEIDCVPLARVLRGAVERSRFNWSRQSLSMVDDLTGLYNSRGMALLTERDARLASLLDLHRWTIELRLEPGPSVDSDLRRLDVAEQLSELAGAGQLAGRIEDDAFVLTGLAPSSLAALRAAEAAAERLRSQCGARDIPLTMRIGTGAAAVLCENR